MDDVRLKEELKRRYEADEARCKRCGRCCGAFDGDPCRNLGRDNENRFFCMAYENRLGIQRTVAGKEFTCVLMRENRKFRAAYPECGYY